MGVYSGLTAERREARAETRQNTLEALARKRASVLEEWQCEEILFNSETSIASDSPNHQLNNSGHSMIRWPSLLESINEHTNASRTRDNVTSSTNGRCLTSSTNALVLRPTCHRRPSCGSLTSLSEEGLDGSLLRASVHLRSNCGALTAVLVSDEIIEADHIQTSFNNGTTIEGDMEDMLLPSARERLQMMEKLLEEQEEELDGIVQESEKRERRMKAVLGVLILSLIIVLVVIIVIQ